MPVALPRVKRPSLVLYLRPVSGLSGRLVDFCESHGQLRELLWQQSALSGAPPFRAGP